MMMNFTQIRQRYAGDVERPLGSFLGLMGVYTGLVSAAGVYARRRRVRVPDKVSTRDIALLAIATSKLSRVLAKDPVTSPLRAPFTEFKGQEGVAEVKEEVIGTGPQKAIGELVTCPLCIGQWIATAMMFGLLVRPRETRLVASVLATVSAADALHFARTAVEEATS
jgi:hypothetical protein